MVIPIVIGALATVIKELIMYLDDLEIKGGVETIQTTALLGSTQNTEKSPGDLSRLSDTQIPEKN